MGSRIRTIWNLDSFKLDWNGGHVEIWPDGLKKCVPKASRRRGLRTVNSLSDHSDNSSSGNVNMYWYFNACRLSSSTCTVTGIMNYELWDRCLQRTKCPAKQNAVSIMRQERPYTSPPNGPQTASAFCESGYLYRKNKTASAFCGNRVSLQNASP